MEKLDQRYFYNEEIIKDYLIRHDKFKSLWNIVNLNGISKQTIWKDVCDVNDKRIDLSASDDNNKLNRFNDAYDLIVGPTNKNFIKGYKSLIGTLLGLFKAPEYEEYKEEKRREIRLTFDYKYMLEEQFGEGFIYKLDYLIAKYRPDFNNNLMTLEHIVALINKGKIKDLQVKVDEMTEDIIKRLAQERYNYNGELIS